jgi:hypothetical protein
MSAPGREPDDGPSKDGPLNYAPKKIRHPELDLIPAGAHRDGDAASQNTTLESGQPPWKRSKRRGSFAGDVAIVELRNKLALAPQRLPEPPPSPGVTYWLTRRLAGIAVVAAVGVIGYRMGSGPMSPAHLALGSGQSNQQGLVSKSAPRPFAEPAAAKAIVAQSDEQTSHEGAPTASPQFTVGAVGPQQADETARSTVSAADAGADAVVVPDMSQPRRLATSEIALMVKTGTEYMANGNIGAARMMLRPAAEAGDPVAAFALAESFDPLVLRKLNARGGITANVGLAQTWYQKAKDLGSAAAPERLERLARLRE